MKKIISVALVLCMLLSLCASVLPAGAVTHGYTRGDANDDSEITMADVLVIRKYIAGIFSVKDINFTAADTDENSDITNSDLLTVRKTVAGLLDEEGNNTDATYHVDKVMIDGKNICRYTIVCTSDNACMKHSAKQLAIFIEEACGIKPDVVFDEDEAEGYIIKFVFDEDDSDDLGTDGYRVFLDEEGNVILKCGSMRGPIHAMTFFLEEVVGYRFLLADMVDVDKRGGHRTTEGSELYYIYRTEEAKMTAGFDEREVPYFSYRAASQAGLTYNNIKYLKDNSGDGADYRGAQAELGWSVGTLFIHAHSYANQDAGYGVEPPSGSGYTQPCLTDEEFYNKVVAYNTALITERNAVGQYLGQTYTQISCSPNDNTDFCTCANCKAVYAVEGSISGTVFRLSNRVAEAMEKFQPGLEVYTIAYWDARRPPKMTQPRDNVCVCFCIGGCNNHTYDNVEACAENGGNERLLVKNWDGESSTSSNVDDLYFFNQWKELTDNLMIWYYSANFCFNMAPSPNLYNIYNDFKYLAEMGVMGIYCEGMGNVFYSYEYLRGYLITKMLWDPFMTEEELYDYFDEYLYCFYGDGWQYIKKAIEMENESSDMLNCWTNNYDRPWNMYSETYFRDHYAEISALYDKAYDAAQTSEEKNRVAYSRLHADWLGLSATYERDYVNGDAQTKKAYAEKYAKLHSEIIEKQIKVANIGGGNDSTHHYVSITGCPNFPDKSTNVMNPMEWIGDDFTGYWQFNGERWV